MIDDMMIAEAMLDMINRTGMTYMLGRYDYPGRGICLLHLYPSLKAFLFGSIHFCCGYLFLFLEPHDCARGVYTESHKDRN